MSDNLQLGLSIILDDKYINEFNKLMNTVRQMQKQLELVGDPLKKIQQPVVDANTQFDRLKKKVNQGTDALNNSKKAAQGLGDSLIHNVKKMAEWAASATLLYGTIRGLQSAFKTMIELETQAVNIAKVLPKEVELRPFEERAIQLAKKYGQSVIDVEKATANWAKQYKNVQSVAITTQSSLLAATATDIGFEESVKSLSAIIAEWNLEAKDSIHIVDMLNEVSNNYRVTAQGVAEALAKSGSGARALGMTMEQLTGIVTTGIQALGMEGNTVGTFWTRTMARMRGNDSAIAAIKSLGIDAMQPLSTLMDEIAAKWDLMTSGEKQNFAITVAGTQHWSRFTGIMDNYNTVIEATAKSYNSFNSAQEEVDRVMQTTAKRIQQLNASWQEYIYRNNGVLAITKGIIDGLRNLITGLSQFNPMVVIAAIGVLTVAFNGLFAAIMSTTTAFSVMTVGLLSNPWTAVIVAVGAVAGALLLMGSNANKAQDEISKMKNELDKIDQYNEGMINKSRGIIDLANKYEIYQRAITKAKNAGQDYSKLTDKFHVAQSALADAIGVSNVALELMIKKDGGIKSFVANRLKENAAVINSEHAKANAIQKSTKADLERQLKPYQDKINRYQTLLKKQQPNLNKAVFNQDVGAQMQIRENITLFTEAIKETQAKMKPIQDEINAIRIDTKKTTIEDFYAKNTENGTGLDVIDLKDKIQPIFTSLTSETLKSIETIGRSWQNQINKVLSPDEQLKNDKATYILKGQNGLLSQSSDINNKMRNDLLKPFEDIDKASKNLVNSFIDIYRQRKKLESTGQYNPQEEVKLQKDIVTVYETYQKELIEHYNALEQVRSQLPSTTEGFKELTDVMANVNAQIQDAKNQADQQNKVIKQYNNLTNTLDVVSQSLNKFGGSTNQAAATLLQTVSKLATIKNGKLSFDWKNMSNEDKGAMAGGLVSMFGEKAGMDEYETNSTAQGAQMGGQIAGGWGALIGGILGFGFGSSKSNEAKRQAAANAKLQRYLTSLSDMNYGQSLSSISDLQERQSFLHNVENHRYDRDGNGILFWRDQDDSRRYIKSLDDEIAITNQMIAATQAKIQEVIKTLSEGLRAAVGSAFSDTSTYLDFVQNLNRSIYEATQDALIQAFVSSTTMKPLYDNLSKLIMDATMDGALSATEISGIQAAGSDIAAKLQPLYQALSGLGDAFGITPGSGGSESSYTAGSATPIVYNNYISIEAGIFMGDEDQARQTALWLRDYIVAEEGRS